MRPIRTILRTCLLLCCLFAPQRSGAQHAAAQPAGSRILDSLQRLYLSALPAAGLIIVDQGAFRALFRPDGIPLTAFDYKELWPGLDGHFVGRTEEGTFLLDGRGQVRSAFSGPVSAADTELRHYRHKEDRRIRLYDASAQEISDSYVEDAEYQTGLYRWDVHNSGVYGVRDTFDRIILPRIFRGKISIGRSGIIAMKDDTAYAYDWRGVFRFRCRADDCMMLPHGVSAVRLYGLWGLKDSTGKALTPYKFNRIEEHQTDAFIHADNTLLDFAGRELASGDFNFVHLRPGGWLDLHYLNVTGPEIRDSGFRIVFRANEYEQHAYIGTRFIRLFKDYNDLASQIYDGRKRRFTQYLVESSLTDEAYVIYAPGTATRQILHGDAVLPLPRFTEVRKVEHHPYFILIDEGKASRGFAGEEERSEFGMLVPDKQARESRSGLLNERMQLVVPLRASRIEVLGRNLIYAYHPKDSAGYLYNGGGKVLLKIRGVAEVKREPVLVRITTSEGTTLTDTLGHVFYRGPEMPFLLYPVARQEFPTRLPHLLLYDDSTGYAGLYDLNGRRLLPHQYYPVAQKVPGLFSLKRGDSLYFANVRGRLMYGGRGFAGRKYHLLEGYGALLQDGSGRWGVLGADGRPLLPFAYDSLELLQPHRGPAHFVLGQNGRYALLDNTGRLRYPLQGPKPIRMIAPDYFHGSDARYYHIREGRAVEAGPEQYGAALRPGRTFGPWEHFREAGPGDDLPPGIYNRSYKKIAPRYSDFSYRFFGDKAVISDSLKQRIAVVDSSGEMLMPYIPNPAALLVSDSALTAVYREGSDLLFHREGGGFVRREIRIDSPARSRILQETRGLHLTNGSLYAFRTAAGARGIVSYRGALLLDERIKDILPDDYAWRIRTGDRWGLLDPSSLRFIHPPEADSIADGGQNHEFRIFRQGLQGVYHATTGSYIPPRYERIYQPATLQHGFVIVRGREGFFVLDKKGRQVSPPLDSITVPSWTLMNTAAWEKGQPVSLSISDEGGIQVNRGLAAKVKRTGISGYYYPVVIVEDGDRQGLYSNETFGMVLPARYDAIDGAEGRGFIAYKYKADKHAGMDSTLLLDLKGRLIIALKGGYRPHHKDGYWFVRGEHRTPLINARGTIILPEGYTLSDMIRNSFFIATKDSLWGIVNDTGRWTVPLIYSEIEYDAYDGSAFLTAKLRTAAGDKYALISSSGFALTKPVYDEIRLRGEEVLFRRGRIYGYLDAAGKEILRAWPEDERNE